MARSFFVSRCPHCHIKTEVEVKWIGRDITCPHCHQAFVAHDPDNFSAALLDPMNYWIKYTDHSWNQPEEQYSNSRDVARTPR